jgi:hypothetical protein
MDSEPFCRSLSVYVCHNPRLNVGPDVGLAMARLTERTVQTAKSGRHSDGDSLHLVVGENGRKTNSISGVFVFPVAVSA